jgi:hypothetical protein
MRKIVMSATLAAVLALSMGLNVPQAFATGSGSVVGAGSGELPASFGSLAGDRLHVALSGRGSTGRFQIVHEGKDGGVKADLSGTIDCISVSGTTAYVTGTITEGRVADAPGFDPAGQIAAITVVDQAATDQAGVDLSFFGGPHSIAPCQAVYPYMSIDRGNFSVV